MRNRGLNNERLMVMLGQSWCMSEIDAILGVHQLENLEYFVTRRNHIANQYDRLLGNVKGISLFKTPANIRHSFHKYPVKCDENIDVEKVAQILKVKFGIETGRVYYPPCHLHPYYKKTFGTREGDFPVAERVLRQVLCLPIHLGLVDEQIKDISGAFEISIGESKK